MYFGTAQYVDGLEFGHRRLSIWTVSGICVLSTPLITSRGIDVKIGRVSMIGRLQPLYGQDSIDLAAGGVPRSDCRFGRP